MSQRRLDLSGWLRSLPPPSTEHLLIGGTGHLLLSPLEQAQASVHLRTSVLPTLIGELRPVRVRLITGLAPGADILFKRVAADWLRQSGIAFETVALLPVPVDVLIEDWLQKASDEAAPIKDGELSAMREGVAGVLADCDTVVDMAPQLPHPAPMADEPFRRRQYRRLAACLAEQTDVLIALLHAESAHQPGGTSEVVEWRRNPASIPPAFSTLMLRTPVTGGRLMVIDPAVAVLNNWRDPVATPEDGTHDPI